MDDPARDPVFTRLSDARDGLLRLHKALLDGQRARFEREHGRIASAGELLQLVIHNPQFDWLHRLSELVVEIDEATDAREPMSADAARGFLAQVRELLTGDGATFGRKLREAVEQDPSVQRVFADVKQRLEQQV